MQRAAQSIVLGFLLFSASLCLAQNNAPNPEQGTASISGRVTIDGKPAHGITVQAISAESNSLPLQMEGKMPIPQVRTDEDGTFRLNNLASGRYQVRPVAPALVGILDKNGTAKLGTIALRADAAIEDVNFTLTRGGVITGRVTYEDGSPVVDAEISALISGRSASHRLFPLDIFHYAKFKTDDRGVYRIYGLIEGEYRVSVMFPRKQTANSRLHQRTVYYPNTDYERAELVEVKLGSEVQNIDIKFGKPDKLYTIAGRVIDANTGKPLPGIVIRCVSFSLETVYATEESKTDKNGEFIFKNMPPGSYRPQIIRTEDENDEYYSETTSFEVTNADVRNLAIKLYKGLSVSGTLVIEGATSSNFAAKLQKLQLRAVSNQRTNTSLESNTTAYAQLSPEGTFIFKGLSPGNVSIYPSEKNLFAILSMERNGTDVSNLQIQAGEIINDLRITIAETNCMIHGQVIIEGGNLPDNALLFITVRRINSDPPDPYDYKFFKDFISVNPDDRFTIPELVAGKYEVTLIVEVRTKDRIDRWIAKQRVSVDSRKTAETTITLHLVADKEK